MLTQFSQDRRWLLAEDDDPHRPTCKTCGVEKSLIWLNRGFVENHLQETRIYQCMVCKAQDEVVIRL